MAVINVTPAYSHGGTSVPYWSAVDGTVIGAGNPIVIASGLRVEVGTLCLFNKGTDTVTFVVEGNGGALSRQGNPPADEWVVYPFCTTQGMTLNAGDNMGISFHCFSCDLPWIRTRITDVAAGGSLVSYVSMMYLADGTPISANNPILTNIATEGM